MKKKNIFTILAVASLVVGFFLPSMVSNELKTIGLVSLICAGATIVLSIASIVQASKNETGKGVGILCLVLGILGALIFGLFMFFLSIADDPDKTEEFCKSVVKCEKGKNDVSTCYIEADKDKKLPIKCYDKNLDKDQYK